MTSIPQPRWLFWHRRDLRLADNLVLAAAAAAVLIALVLLQSAGVVHLPVLGGSGSPGGGLGPGGPPGI